MTPVEVSIDYEYNKSQERHMGLVSCSLQVRGGEVETFWLHDGSDTDKLISRIDELRGCIWITYNAQMAEARCFAALGISPTDHQWRDIMLEWNWLRNKDQRFSYGHIVRGGMGLFSRPPRARVRKKATTDEKAEAASINAEYLSELRSETGESNLSLEGISKDHATLLDCLYYFQVITVKQYSEAKFVKDIVRDQIIVKGSHQDIEDAKDKITAYNSSDISDLFALADAVTLKMVEVGGEYHKLFAKGLSRIICFEPEQVYQIQLNLGLWAARLAKYSARGIPLNKARLERMIKQLPVLQAETRDAWVRKYPDSPLYRIGPSRSDMETRKQPLQKSPYIGVQYVEDDNMFDAVVEEYKRSSGNKSWPKNQNGHYEANKPTYTRYAQEGNIIKDYERHQNALSALSSFGVNKKLGRIEALDFIGSDTCQRPNHGPFGTQTARNTASAKSYVFLGAHWMRILVDPPEGYTLVELDFAQQEFWISAVYGDDERMMEAYLSPDVYLFYAQLVGMYPDTMPICHEDDRQKVWGDDYDKWKKIRDIAKQIVLSIGYGSGGPSVAAAVRGATKDMSITDDQGHAWVRDFYNTYAGYGRWVADTKADYQHGTPMALINGWRMGLEADTLSAANMPVQGTGSMILMESCRLVDDKVADGNIIATLHDAITLICRNEVAEKVAQEASHQMRQAAENILGRPGMKVGNPEFIRHGDLWLHSGKAREAWKGIKKSFLGIC